MTRPLPPELSAIEEEPLTPEAFDRAVAAALADEAENLRQIEHIRWLRRRYPTTEQRLRYARALYAQWVRPAGPGSDRTP